MAHAESNRADNPRSTRRSASLGPSTRSSFRKQDVDIHSEKRIIGPSRDMSGLLPPGSSTSDSARDRRNRIDELVKGVRTLIISPGIDSQKEVPITSNVFAGRPWLTPEFTTFVFASEPLQVFVDNHGSLPRVLVYDDIADYLVYLGKTAEEAAEMWNFPDLTKWQLVDDATGEVTPDRVNDPELQKEIVKELAKTYPIPPNWNAIT